MTVAPRTRRAAWLCGLALVARASVAAAGDGHARPRALAVDAVDGRVYAALSTADALAVVDASGDAPRVVARVPVCRFPDALAALPGGGALVACRFEPALRRVTRAGARYVVAVVPAGAEAGARGLVLSPDGAFAYVASPATGGVKVVSLAGRGVVQALPTGLSPRALRVVTLGARAWLLVSTFVDRKVTAHPIAADGRLGDAVQTIATEAPVLDLAVADGALWLATHEDRPLSRPTGAVEGLDSGVLVLPVKTTGATPFEDPGPGRRRFVNTSERAVPVVELASFARAPSGALAVVGAGTDNLLVGAPNGEVVAVGAAPAAVVALPGPAPRWVTADRLSDTLTFVGPAVPGGPQKVLSLDVGASARTSPADLGELMFYSRALTPRNVATGPLSLYTCAACHDDGHVDGRRHPSKRNRFFSMTKSCRGLGATPPYLSLGEPETIEAFADNIVATHAQGADKSEDYDRYPVTLRVRAAGGWGTKTLSPDDVRAALAAYMARIPVEPSPFVSPGRRAFSADERRGLGVFRGRCASCHQLVGDTKTSTLVPARALEGRLLAGQVALTSARLYDVGTPVLGKTGNNPPSLRGVWDAAPYFSDGSARSLDDVLDRTDPAAEKVHAPGNASRPSAFTPADRAALLAFLRAL
jgi:mono/diheme cytochrome c family protein